MNEETARRIAARVNTVPGLVARPYHLEGVGGNWWAIELVHYRGSNHDQPEVLAIVLQAEEAEEAE